MEKNAARLLLFIILISGAALFFTGCQTAQSIYDSTRDILGIQKRGIMIGEIKDARESLEEVREQFQSSMDKFRTVLNSSEGKLEEKYKALKSESQNSEKKALEIQKSMDSVTRAAESMFAEWEAELIQYNSENLRSGSEQRMQEAKRQNNTFMGAMALVNEKAGPVLLAFRDLVLFSRHNLNAETAESLVIELDAAADKVASFSQEIDAAIGEADALVNLLAGSEPARKQE